MDLSKYGDAEKVIIKAFKKNEFEKNGVRETCRRLADKHGYAASGLRKTYTNMKKYGAFRECFPERFGIVIKQVQEYTPFATRLKYPDNIFKLEELAHHRKDSKQKVINDLIEEAHNQTEWTPSKWITLQYLK